MEYCFRKWFIVGIEDEIVRKNIIIDNFDLKNDLEEIILNVKKFLIIEFIF